MEAREDSRRSLYEAIRFLVVIGTLGILSALAFYLVALGFGAGVAEGARSGAGVVLPILGGSFLFMADPRLFERLRGLPSAAAFGAAAGAGVLVMLALRILAHRSQVPVTELLVASCVAVLVFTPGSVPALAFGGGDREADPTLSYYYGITSGMLAYVVLCGIPTVG